LQPAIKAERFQKCDSVLEQVLLFPAASLLSLAALPLSSAALYILSDVWLLVYLPCCLASLFCCLVASPFSLVQLPPFSNSEDSQLKPGRYEFLFARRSSKR
jgi:hypothetical protein